LEYRSKLDLTENVRIVEIPGVDTCACCAPHTETTGQIGLIKITNVQSHRGGVRVNILCGKRAVADYTAKQNSTSAISVLLSAKQSAITDAVSRLKDENLRLKDLGNTLQASLLDYAVKSLPENASAHAILFIDVWNEIAIRNTVNDLTTKYPGYTAIFAGNDTDGYRFIICSARKDCRELAKLLRQSFSAKGGGSAPMIQGTVPPIALSQNTAAPTASASQSNIALKTALEEFLLSQ
jgi:alanyl-tRNA synthetase